MPLIRLLAVLFICCLSSIAQDQAKVNGAPVDSQEKSAAPTEPWKIVLAQPRSADTANDVLARLQSGPSQFTVDRSGRALLTPDAQNLLFDVSPLPGDDICYTIRSYVVARDAKDSDSTHPVKSSTCQPGSRYRLKTAVSHGEKNR